MYGKYNRLVSEFKKTYPGVEPTYCIRVPGRVNLIGEHVDYNGLPALPMAMEREIRMLVGPLSNNSIRVHNTSPQYSPREFTISNNITPYSTGDWGNYIKAGVQGIVNMARESVKNDKFHGFAALIESDLPPAAGLSSSSAMVVASALAGLAVNNLTISRQELADRLAIAEKYVGTMGGGMDHAAILLSAVGSALLIEFFPLRAATVPLPRGYSIVVCNSMVIAPKTEAARRSYNRLPIECRLAAMILRKEATALYQEAASARRLADLLAFVPTGHLYNLIDQTLVGKEWSKESIAIALGVSLSELEQEYLLMGDGQLFPQPADGFLLAERMMHVIAEGERVRASVQALEKGDASQFGQLMNASHASCRDLLHISCPELDKLVDIARGAGAVGARLTGAGFGGCVVALVPSDQLSQFRTIIIERYYNEYLKQNRPQLYQAAQALGYDNIVLASTPQSGAAVSPLPGGLAVLSGT